MRSRLAASALVTAVTALSACSNAAFPAPPPVAASTFSVQQLPPRPSPPGWEVHARHGQALTDHPPELSGLKFSPGDYVVTARGTCHGSEGPTKWAYVVAAPGFGPVRQVGLPSSGLYVVLAVVSGKRAGPLLEEMIDGAR